MFPMDGGECHCSFCDARIEVSEARAAEAILTSLDAGVYWKVREGMGRPHVEPENPFENGVLFPVCIACVTVGLYLTAELTWEDIDEPCPSVDAAYMARFEDFFKKNPDLLPCGQNERQERT